MHLNTPVNKKDEETNFPRSREDIVQQRKLKVKARKLEQKVAKKHQKEEENFKLRTVSKYHGVTLINMKEADKETANNLKENVSVPKLSDFPSLGSSGNKKKILRKNVEVTAGEIIKKGKPKRTDPISINLFDVIVDKKSIKKTAVSVIKSKPNNLKISGNILDSDNPQRKRGKVRPGKKRKVSSRKACILKARQEKLNLRNFASANLLKSKRLSLTTDEIINYNFLVNLKNFKHPESKESNDESSARVTNEKKAIHSKRFREYCENVISPPLVESVCSLLSTIVKFQDRLYARDPIKAHAKRRYVTGLRESEKYLKLGKVQLLIIAPDLEQISGEKGLDNIVLRLKEEAQRKFVPYVFGPNRKKLGHCAWKKQKVGAIAILKYEGAEEQFNLVISLLNEARIKYKELVEQPQPESNVEEQKFKNNQAIDVNKEEIISLFLEKLKIKDKQDYATEQEVLAQPEES